MKVQLVINGEDHRVRIIPENASDKQILELIKTKDIGRIEIVNEKPDYGYSQSKIVKYIDILLEVNSVSRAE